MREAKSVDSNERSPAVQSFKQGQVGRYDALIE